MTHEALDLITATVEDTTAHLKKLGLLPTEEAEFLFSRLIEYAIRGKSVGQILKLLHLNHDGIRWKLKKVGAPNTQTVMWIGIAAYAARAILERGWTLDRAARSVEANTSRMGSILDRCFGLRVGGIQGKEWPELVERYLDRHWPAWAGRKVAA